LSSSCISSSFFFLFLLGFSSRFSCISFFLSLSSSCIFSISLGLSSSLSSCTFSISLLCCSCCSFTCRSCCTCCCFLFGYFSFTLLTLTLLFICFTFCTCMFFGLSFIANIKYSPHINIHMGHGSIKQWLGVSNPSSLLLKLFTFSTFSSCTLSGTFFISLLTYNDNNHTPISTLGFIFVIIQGSEANDIDDMSHTFF
jgi:hypothetical protein